MHKILIFLFIFLLSGCSIDTLMVWGEIDKVHIVKRTSYLKHYRAYFQRNTLKAIRHGKKYLYFYNKRTKDLAILLHPKNRYILYSFSHPNLTIKIRADRKHGYYYMIKTLRHKGYRLTSPTSIGYTAHVSLRRYKGVKTYLVEVKDYQYLQSLYQKAIRNYDASLIEKIGTKLPKSLIDTYYKKYSMQPHTEAAQKELERIASKLQLNTPESQTETTVSDPQSNDNEVLYTHYLHHASYYELNSYLSTSEAKTGLTPAQYAALKRRNSYLKEQKLLHEGSLEELITAYKKDNNPHYKSKIMQRIKEIQQEK